ncbi:UPF0481 protein At3g47200-like [Panicum virgatum]|uniref:Uncharacterized protein n=1 Tax=Panicum virgatum TaxID=38727 RepID=A0A8T0PT86_PANVG|nr:UPF0481 protein At3g47200-like [Panicum virgatum]KAG2564137.1 hypothetical protein PVAP13_8KG329100 [Panicum virgatum]KAG2564138.1 hypothetical protein PVAP13_8KG329100 [Panicum virgatum]
MANYWSTEPAASWAPCDLEVADWTVRGEPVAGVWAPPGLPVEYVSTHMFGTGLQAYVPESGGGQQQLVEHYAAATQHDPIEKEARESFEVVLHSMEMEINNNPIHVFEDVASEFEADIDMMKVKIHRYPPSIRDLGDSYTMPRIVAIGPYHHGQEQLKKAEQAKHVAAYHCIRESGCSVREMYDAVVTVADDARRLYDKDVMAGIGYDDFRHMMFFDACFLVQYMVWYADDSGEMVDPSLNSFFYSNSKGISHDVLLLQNQLPWRVVETIMKFKPLDLKEFVAPWRDILQDRVAVQEKSFDLDDSYEPPHLLGLLRRYIVGSTDITDLPTVGKIESVSYSVSAIKLAEIGITLTANKATELINMGLHKKGIFFAELSLVPLSLDSARANWLVNMAALELCMTPSFLDAKDEDSVVCSYLLLLSMLVHRVEDVHELRTKGILQGGTGLTDKEALEFFKSLHGLPLGSYYAFIMVEIESYRVSRRIRTKVHSFIHKKKNTIFRILSIIVAIVGIFGTLVGILVKLKSLKASR